MREALDRVAGPGLRPRLARPRLARPGGRAGRRHAGPRRAHLPRGAPRLRADRRVRHRRLVRGGRVEPDPRSREHDRADRRRARRERARPDDPLSAQRRRGRRGDDDAGDPGDARASRPRATYSCRSSSARVAQRGHLGRREALEQRRRACATCRGSSPTTRRATPPPTSTATSSTRSISSPPRATTEREPLGIGEPERPGRVGVGWLGEPELERGPAGRGDPGVDAASSPRRRAPTRPPGRRTRAISAAARSMSGTSISPKRQRIPSTDVVARASELGGVLDGELDTLEAELGGAPARDLDHLRRGVRREQLAARAGSAAAPGTRSRRGRPRARGSAARAAGSRSSTIRSESSSPWPARTARAVAPSPQRRCARPRPARPRRRSMPPRP